jgi:hypothetical protein
MHSTSATHPRRKHVPWIVAKEVAAEVRAVIGPGYLQCGIKSDVSLGEQSTVDFGRVRGPRCLTIRSKPQPFTCRRKLEYLECWKNSGMTVRSNSCVLMILHDRPWLFQQMQSWNCGLDRIWCLRVAFARSQEGEIVAC